MSIESYAITAQELWSLIGTERAPQIVDTRKRAVYDAAPGLLPTTIWRDIAEISQWSATLDRARPDLAPEAAGLHAVSLGLSALAGDDDHGMLRHGFLVYDALFAWLRFAAAERHN
jgi:hypothetical protein